MENNKITPFTSISLTEDCIIVVTKSPIDGKDVQVVMNQDHEGLSIDVYHCMGEDEESMNFKAIDSMYEFWANMDGDTTVSAEENAE